MHGLIVGTGSVGKRHAINLRKLGVEISIVDPLADRRRKVADEVDVKAAYQSLEDALKAQRFDLAVISSPSSFHAPQALLLIEHEVPTLVEKPLATTLSAARHISEMVEEAGVPTLLGYTWRWWPPLLQLKQMISQGDIGPPLVVQATLAAHLADWHPWEDYRNFYMAHSEMGGGALLDESHWIDLMIWLFGMPDAVVGAVDHISPLEIDTDDNVDLLMTYRDPGLRVNIHLDLLSRPHERSIRVVGETGTIVWSYQPNQVSLWKNSNTEAKVWDFNFDRNLMFLEMTTDFLEVAARVKDPSCTVKDGVAVLTIIEAVLLSNKSGRRIELGA